MPALKWLRMLVNHIPDKYEHLVRYYGHYSNRSRGARRLVENRNDVAESIRIDEPSDNIRRKANWARLIQKIYKVDPLKCTRRSRIIQQPTAGQYALSGIQLLCLQAFGKSVVGNTAVKGLSSLDMIEPVLLSLGDRCIAHHQLP